MKALAVSLRKTLLTIGATLCIALGLVGVFLPVLPTTPFLILATVLSYNASPKLRNWLLEHPLFGATIQDFLENRSISKTALRSALISLWLCLAVSILLIQKVVVILILLVIGTGVTAYLLRLKRKE